MMTSLRTGSDISIYKGGADDVETSAMKNCSMLLATKAAAADSAAVQAIVSGAADDADSKYACKTCGRKFKSFQALGGHRASHQKLKPVVVGAMPVKPKSHACTICGAEFEIGQALGGHMRRHRPLVAPVSGEGSIVTMEISQGNSSNEETTKKRKSDDALDEDVIRPVLKKSNSSKRVCLDLNLNIEPWIVKDEKPVDDEIEEGEIVEQGDDDEDDDFLKLELRQPIRD